MTDAREYGLPALRRNVAWTEKDLGTERLASEGWASPESDVEECPWCHSREAHHTCDGAKTDPPKHSESDFEEPASSDPSLIEQLQLAERHYMDAGDGDRASVMYHAWHRIDSLERAFDMAKATIKRRGLESPDSDFEDKCGDRFGSKVCVLDVGHDGLHQSFSKTVWGSADRAVSEPPDSDLPASKLCNCANRHGRHAHTCPVDRDRCVDEGLEAERDALRSALERIRTHGAMTKQQMRYVAEEALNGE